MVGRLSVKSRIVRGRHNNYLIDENIVNIDTCQMLFLLLVKYKDLIFNNLHVPRWI